MWNGCKTIIKNPRGKEKLSGQRNAQESWPHPGSAWAAPWSALGRVGSDGRAGLGLDPTGLERSQRREVQIFPGDLGEAVAQGKEGQGPMAFPRGDKRRSGPRSRSPRHCGQKALMQPALTSSQEGRGPVPSSWAARLIPAALGPLQPFPRPTPPPHRTYTSLEPQVPPARPTAAWWLKQPRSFHGPPAPKPDWAHAKRAARSRWPPALGTTPGPWGALRCLPARSPPTGRLTLQPEAAGKSQQPSPSPKPWGGLFKTQYPWPAHELTGRGPAGPTVTGALTAGGAEPTLKSRTLRPDWPASLPAASWEL